MPVFHSHEADIVGKRGVCGKASNLAQECIQHSLRIQFQMLLGSGYQQRRVIKRAFGILHLDQTIGKKQQEVTVQQQYFRCLVHRVRHQTEHRLTLAGRVR